MEPTCSFCAEERTPDCKLIAGPKAFICAKCVRLAAEMLADASLNGKVHCAVCRNVVPPEECLIFEGKGHLCANCVRTVLAATKGVIPMA